MFSWEPAGHRVIVRVDNVEETDDVYKAVKKAGLYVPDHLKNREQKSLCQGVVTHVGRTAFRDFGDGEPWASVGDRVLFVKYAGSEYLDPETKELYRFINDVDIFGVQKNNG